MPKAATLPELEQFIEALQPSDQLQLLERMVHNLKLALLRENPENIPKRTSTDYASVRGALKQYANPALRTMEPSAYAQAMQVKHAIC